MTDKVLDWVREKKKKLNPYKEFREDFFLILMSLLSIGILVSMVYMVSSLNPDQLRDPQLKEFNNFRSRFQTQGWSARLDFVGYVLSPVIVVLSLMVIAREVWKYRKRRWDHAERKEGSIFMKFTYYLSEFEDVLNELLIAFLSLGVLALLFFSALILTGNVSDGLLKGVIQAKFIAQTVYNWTIMLALIIIARESYVIKNNLLKET